jgi:hypothetical protein
VRYIFFEHEYRVYRSPQHDPLAMEQWNFVEHIWEPYLGDAARVIRDASQSMTQPAVVEFDGN